MAAFSEWQPHYAACGIATFPVAIDAAAKRPAVKGYLKLGPRVSAQLALKFQDADALGFALGRRSRVTVLDVDTTDERVLADALDRHGQTPVVVRSGSGNYQAWFRHAGEGRRIRPFAALPIDVLGGGYVVAPPSRGARGRYEFIAGGLADLDRLPAMRGLPSDIVVGQPAVTPAPPSASDLGKRNDGLWHACMAEAHECQTPDDMLAFARSRNASLCPPLTDAEVIKVAGSAWRFHRSGRNFAGGMKVVQMLHDEVDGLLHRQPDAFVLLTLLRRHHWGRDFVIANAMAETMPGGGWTRKRFAAARAALEAEGRIVLVRPAGYREAPLYRLVDLRMGWSDLTTNKNLHPPLSPLLSPRSAPASVAASGLEGVRA